MLDESGPSRFGDALGFLSLCAAGEPYYVGSSAGFTLANLVQASLYESVTASPAESNETHFLKGLPTVAERPFSCHRPQRNTPRAPLPVDEGLASMLLDSYIDRVHSVYPFLDRPKLLTTHASRLQLADEQPPVGDEWGADRCNKLLILSKLHLVYGIGARLTQLASNRTLFDDNLPEAHFVAATAYFSEIFELRTTDTIAILLLLAIYSLYSPSGPGAWQLSGMALRLCVELGLHRKSQKTGHPTMVDEHKKRLFWSALVLERRVAVTLGRPFCLSDWDIGLDLPADIDDGLSDPSALPQSTEQYSHIGQTVPVAISMSLLICRIRLQPLIAVIQRHNVQVQFSVYQPSTEHLETTQTALDQWLRQVSSMPSGEPKARFRDLELRLDYHKACHLLLQPFITSSKHCSSDRLAQLAKSAGAICQGYKDLHLNSPVAFSLLDLHDVLVAGTSLLYCFSTDSTHIDSLMASADLGACSTVLFLIAEKWNSAKRYRDAFEALCRTTMAHKSCQTTGIANSAAFSFGVPPENQSYDLWDPSVPGESSDTVWTTMLEQVAGFSQNAGQSDLMKEFEDPFDFSMLLSG